ERDARANRVAEAAARDAADDLAVCSTHRLGAERDRPRVVEHEADELLRRLAERVASDELALVALHGEREPGLVRRSLGVQVARPGAVALLEPQRVDRSVPARCDAVDTQRVPEPQPVLRRAVELPAELA